MTAMAYAEMIEMVGGDNIEEILDGAQFSVISFYDSSDESQYI